MSDLVNALNQQSRSSGVLDQIAHPQMVNPLAAYTGAAHAAETMYNLRGQQAQEALGQAYQQAIDPATGRLDPLKLNQLVAANPLTALAAKAGAESSQNLQGQQLQQNTGVNSVLNGALASVLTLPDNQLQQGVLQQAQRLIDAGYPADRVHAGLLNLSSDPATLRQQLTVLHNQTLSPTEREAVTFGKPTTIDQGTGVQGATQSQRGGGITTSGGAVPVYAGPGTQGTPVRWTDTEGVQHDTTWAEYNTARNNGRVVGPATIVPQDGATGGGGGGGGPSPTNPPRLTPKASSPAPTPTTPPLTDTTGPKPGQAEKWKASADSYNAENAASANYQQRIFPLAQADDLLRSGDVTTGPGAEGVNRIKEWLATRAATFGWDAQTVQQAKFDELNKYLTQAVNANPFAASSDARLASAISGNPSAHITTLANKQVVQAMIGLERMRQAAMLTAKAQGVEPKDFSDFQQKFGSSNDARAFVLDRLTPEQQEKMINSMTPAERKAFNNSLAVIAANPSLMNLPAMPH